MSVNEDLLDTLSEVYESGGTLFPLHGRLRVAGVQKAHKAKIREHIDDVKHLFSEDGVGDLFSHVLSICATHAGSQGSPLRVRVINWLEEADDFNAEDDVTSCIKSLITLRSYLKRL